MRLLRVFLVASFLSLLKLAIAIGIFLYLIYISPPDIVKPADFNKISPDLNNGILIYKNNWLKKSESGIWELYFEGDAFERGVVTGILTKDLIKIQEEAFIKEIKRMIPSESFLSFLKYFVGWFNRKIDEHIIPEFQAEIYGVSLSASEDFDEVGPAYLRFLNYHAAHDIGHSLQNMGIVGCTSFAAWDSAGENNKMIAGRNFDFYVGDDFSKEKIVAFCNPSSGYKFAFITWGGMTGVVSGMNEKGLAITLNAAPSEIPSEAKTPVSILAREILQYSKNIEEAVEIAQKRKTFVSESFLICSAQDNKAVVIEKNTDTLAVYSTQNDYIVSANHYQSSLFKNSKVQIENRENSSSYYRQKRVEEMIIQKKPLNYIKASEILRDQKGLNGKDIGMANEKAINQLIAHHSVIFIPSELKMWVSTKPYQLGKYVAYDLNRVFKDTLIKNGINDELYEDSLTIPADKFLFTKNYIKFETFRKVKAIITEYAKYPFFTEISPEQIDLFISLNPEYYLTYKIAGDYYLNRNDFKKAMYYFETALEKEVTTDKEVVRINQAILKCKQAE